MATLNDLIDPNACGLVDDKTVITVMRGDIKAVGNWYQDNILEYLNEEAEMIVYDGHKNTLDVMLRAY